MLRAGDRRNKPGVVTSAWPALCGRHCVASSGFTCAQAMLPATLTALVSMGLLAHNPNPTPPYLTLGHTPTNPHLYHLTHIQSFTLSPTPSPAPTPTLIPRRMLPSSCIGLQDVAFASLCPLGVDIQLQGHVAFVEGSRVSANRPRSMAAASSAHWTASSAQRPSLCVRACSPALAQSRASPPPPQVLHCCCSCLSAPLLPLLNHVMPLPLCARNSTHDTPPSVCTSPRPTPRCMCVQSCGSWTAGVGHRSW